MVKQIIESFLSLFSLKHTILGSQEPTSTSSASSSNVPNPLIPPTSSTNLLSDLYPSYKGAMVYDHHQHHHHHHHHHNFQTSSKYAGDINCVNGVAGQNRVGDVSNKSSTTTLSEATSLYSSQLYDVIGNQACNASMHVGQGKTTWIMAAFLLINAALGAGLLNYPVAYDRLGGIVFATIIQVFAALLMISTILVLVYCAQINNEDSYHGVMRTMCGPGIMQISAASIAITCFGVCVTFIIIIGDQFDRIFATYIGMDFCNYWYANRFFTMSITAVVTTWPMCYFRRLDFLRHINVLGVLASFYIIFLNVYEYYNHKPDPNRKLNIRTSPESALEFIAALPVVFFAYQTHEIIIPVYDSMKEKNIKSFSKSVSVAMIALLLLYCLAGTFGYLTFGSNVAPDIMLMYDANDPIVLAGVIALIIKMISTYPPVVFAGRDTIVRLILSRYHQSYRGYQCLDDDGVQSTMMISQERRYNILITTSWNVLVLILAIVIPNITIAIGFLGSLASCNVFIFPGLALLALAKRHSKMRRKKFQFDYSDEDEDEDEGDGLRNKRQQESNNKQRFFSLKHRSFQIFTQLYGFFIIGLGVTMFVIILIQVYHDFQKQTNHGAVCDVGAKLIATNVTTTTIPTTYISI